MKIIPFLILMTLVSCSALIEDEKEIEKIAGDIVGELIEDSLK